MKCKKCGGELEVLRICSAVKMRCKSCDHCFAIGEVADQLDEATETLLERYNVIIYD